MFKRCSLISIIWISLLTGKAWSKLEVSLTDATWEDGRASLSLEAKNKGDGSITGARVWIFLMNDSGKVVGNHAEWIIGGKRAEDKPNPDLEAGSEAKYAVNFKSEQAFTTARVTFSKVLCAN